MEATKFVSNIAVGFLQDKILFVVLPVFHFNIPLLSAVKLFRAPGAEAGIFRVIPIWLNIFSPSHLDKYRFFRKFMERTG